MLHPLAVLYAFNDWLGTYITALSLPCNTLSATVGGVVANMVMEVSALHIPNAWPPIDVTVEGTVTDVRLEHHANAELPIDSRPSFNVTDERLLHT